MTRRRRILGCSLLLGLACIVLTGCWNRTELNEISIVSASGIDWKNGKWVVSYQLVLPQAIASKGTGSSTGTAPVNVFSTSGDTIRGAISKSSFEMSRRLYFSQNQIVVISESAARHGLSSLLDAYLRNPDSRETVSVYLTKESARDVLEHLIPLEEIPGAAIERMGTNEAKNGSALPNMSMYNVLIELLGPTKAVGIPGLQISGGDPLDSIEKMSKTFSSSKIKLQQIGVVLEDKLVGWMGQEEGYGAMWIRNQVQQSSVWFPCNKEEAMESAVMMVNHTETKLKPAWDNGTWKLRAHVKAKGTLLEYPCEADLTKPDNVEELERLAAAKIARIMQKGFKSAQELKADFIGFGDKIRQKHPAQWNKISKRWNEELFPETKLEADVEVVIQRTGMSTDSFRKIQQKAGD